MSENKFTIEREFVKEMSDKRRVRMSLIELQRRLIELGGKSTPKKKEDVSDAA